MSFAGCFSVFLSLSSIPYSCFGTGTHTLMPFADCFNVSLYARFRFVFRFYFSPRLFSVRSTVSDTQRYAVTGSLLVSLFLVWYARFRLHCFLRPFAPRIATLALRATLPIPFGLSCYTTYNSAFRFSPILFVLPSFASNTSPPAFP